MAGNRSGWGIDLLVGGLCGLIAGAILAVNLVIFLGVEGGYEANVGDVFDHSVVIGVVVAAVLLAGPVGGVAHARWRRRLREGRRNVHVEGGHAVPGSGRSTPGLLDRRT